MQKVDLLKEYGLYINGEFVPASDGTTFAAHNPANGEALALCAEATKQDVDRAVKAVSIRKLLKIGYIWRFYHGLRGFTCSLKCV